MLTERNAPQTATLATTQPAHPTRTAIEARTPLGLLPVISLVSAAGFALVALAFYASRRQWPWGEPLFWLGIAVLVLPILFRLIAASPGAAERAGLLIALTVGLYLVKVAYSPVAFTFPDELAHEYNVLQILDTGRLFQPNPILGITTVYPGLASVTSAIAMTTGLSAFHSGLLVVGAARLLLVLTLFVLVERLTHSARTAGLAAALYTANPDYLFFSAEFAYESVALPISAGVLFALLRRHHSESRGARAAWTGLAILLTLSVVVSHHLTSYALIAALWGMVIVSRIGLFRARPAALDVAVIATVAVGVWFLFVASDTYTYLSTVLGNAVVSLVGLLTLQQAPRQVFDASSAFGATPLWQEFLAFGAILVIVVGLPFGLVRLWRTSRRQSIAVILAIAGALYIPAQLLRLTPGSWETGNRASEFLFIGVSFVLALALTAVRRDFRAPEWLPRAGIGAYVAIVFLGGVVVSWRPDLRLPRAYDTMAVGRDVAPEGVTVAQWSRQFIGTENNVATDESNAMLLALYGQQWTWSGSAHGIRRMIGAPTVDSGALAALSSVGARYVVMDRRSQSADHLVGIYPLPGSSGPTPNQLIDPAAFAKFDAEPDVSRVADSGNIVVFDVSRLSAADASAIVH